MLKLLKSQIVTKIINMLPMNIIWKLSRNNEKKDVVMKFLWRATASLQVRDRTVISIFRLTLDYWHLLFSVANFAIIYFDQDLNNSWLFNCTLCSKAVHVDAATDTRKHSFQKCHETSRDAEFVFTLWVNPLKSRLKHEAFSKTVCQH